MHSTSHLTAEMMGAVLDQAFSKAVTQADKDSARHLREILVATHANYQSVVFDVLEMTAGADRTALAEMVSLVGMQAGYELGIAYPPHGRG